MCKQGITVWENYALTRNCYDFLGYTIYYNVSQLNEMCICMCDVNSVEIEAVKVYHTTDLTDHKIYIYEKFEN